MKLFVVLEASEEGGYTAYVPSLPGCLSEGETREEALANVQEAIQLYLEPIEDDLAIAPTEVKVPRQVGAALSGDREGTRRNAEGYEGRG
jgi:predicted RNase H-like HicB family nuclease